MPNLPRGSLSSGIAHLMKALGIATIGVLLLLNATRMLMDHPAHYDELLHALAARGVVTTGEPMIGTGTYPRAELFTLAVAESYQLAGDSLTSARLPALLSGAVLVAGAGMWIALQVGVGAGMTTVVLLALLPLTIDMSVFARFYTMHACTVLAMCLLVFAALKPTIAVLRRLVFVGLALVAFLVSWHLQDSTMVALLALIAACCAVMIYDHFALAKQVFLNRPLTVIAGTVLILVGGLIAAWQMEFIAALRSTPLWASSTANSFNYYNGHLKESLPMLWPLFPLAAALALRRSPRLTIFCTSIAIVGLAVHSIAAAKSSRYIYYLYPYLCIVLAIGMIELHAVARQLASNAVPGFSGMAGNLLITALLIFVLANSIEGTRAVKTTLHPSNAADYSEFDNEPDWRQAELALRPFIADPYLVITTSGVKAIHALGRYDYELNSSVVVETATREEFSEDPRTGGHVISTLQSVESILDRSGNKLFVADDTKVDNPIYISTPIKELLNKRCTRLAVPIASRVVAWQCAPQAS